MDRLAKIIEVVSSLDGIIITSPFQQKGEVITGGVQATVESAVLQFDVVIKIAYPLQFHGSETIQFFNASLNSYDHVMKNGHICIHTAHSPDLAQKLYFDFSSLKEWIKRFYLNGESETHYEHIVAPIVNESHYFFTEVDKIFTAGDYGHVKYSTLARTQFDKVDAATHLVQQFESNGTVARCDWSDHYHALPSDRGIYIYTDAAPVTSRKFAFENWKDFESLLSQDFLGFLYKFQKNNGRKAGFPLLVGYRISPNEIHWQAIHVKGNDLFIHAERVKGTNTVTYTLKDKLIPWAQTKNCSYHYFFGRGSLSEKLTTANILVIGVGAIGSMVATALTRGGCRKMMLTDHDRKEPENVCRSEYAFKTGVTPKVKELAETLTSISPFAEISTLEVLMDAAKVLLENDEHSGTLSDLLNAYDVIFDCSTDDDVAYVLERYQVKGQVFNLSITNQAKELVCVTSPNVYHWLNEVFKKFTTDNQDLYNPTGCWNPTFKASHNDIAVLVQYALKNINSTYLSGAVPRSFYLSTSGTSGFTINLTQF